MAVGREIAVIGAGVAGLSAGLALRGAGHHVEIFEKAPAIRASGGALLLWSNALRALEALGVAEPVLRAGTLVQTTEFRTHDGRLLWAMPVAELSHRAGAPTLLIPRAELLEILSGAFGPVQLGRQCVDFDEEGDRVLIRFEDGSLHRCDALVGADGLHSFVRSRALGSTALRSAKQMAWVGIVDYTHPLLAPGTTVATVGRGLRFWAGGIGGGKIYWYATVRDAAADVHSMRELASLFQHFHAPVSALITATEPAAVVRTPVRDRPPARSWGRGPVTLIGDAAHPATPDLGQGACQALEDAVALVTAVTRHSNLPAAFEAYQRARLDRTARITNLSWLTAVQSMSADPIACRVRDLGMRTLLPTLARGELAWILGARA
jgi:2-polyprenyl-6-methoxyphenol hydroxylase-like FAD-dependent oxidoreductase